MVDDNAADEVLLALGFMLNTAFFAVDARLVQEVVKVGEITPVFAAPSGVLGIRNLRGRIVTVIDMATHLGVGTVAADAGNRLLIMDHQGEYYGFLVAALTDTFTLEVAGIDTAPANLEPELRSRLRGVWRDDDRLTALLDSRTLFDWDLDV